MYRSAFAPRVDAMDAAVLRTMCYATYEMHSVNDSRAMRNGREARTHRVRW